MKKHNELTIYEMKKAYDMLFVLEANPNRFISSNTITALQDFINGYLTGNPYPEDSPPFWDFQNYLISVTKFKYEGGTKNVIAKILLKECNDDQKESYLRFFEYLKQYKNEKK